MNARTETLVQRYSETRRRHPLSKSVASGDSDRTLVEYLKRR